MLPRLVKVWKWRWWILGGLVIVFVIGLLPWISTWLKSQFSCKTKWDFIEKIFIPVVPPATIGFGVWYLDKNAKDRESKRQIDG